MFAAQRCTDGGNEEGFAVTVILSIIYLMCCICRCAMGRRGPDHMELNCGRFVRRGRQPDYRPLQGGQHAVHPGAQHIRVTQDR